MLMFHFGLTCAAYLQYLQTWEGVYSLLRWANWVVFFMQGFFFFSWYRLQRCSLICLNFSCIGQLLLNFDFSCSTPVINIQINLSANQLTTIPTTFGQLRSLKVLLSLLSQMARCVLCQSFWKFGCWVVPCNFFFWCISCFAFDWELESEMRCRYSFLTTMH